MPSLFVIANPIKLWAAGRLRQMYTIIMIGSLNWQVPILTANNKNMHIPVTLPYDNPNPCTLNCLKAHADVNAQSSSDNLYSPKVVKDPRNVLLPKSDRNWTWKVFVSLCVCPYGLVDVLWFNMALFVFFSKALRSAYMRTRSARWQKLKGLQPTLFYFNIKPMAQSFCCFAIIVLCWKTRASFFVRG